MVSTVFQSLEIFSENGKNLTSLGLHSHLPTISGSMLWPWRWDSCAVVASTPTPHSFRVPFTP